MATTAGARELEGQQKDGGGESRAPRKLPVGSRRLPTGVGLQAAGRTEGVRWGVGEGLQGREVEMETTAAVSREEKRGGSGNDCRPGGGCEQNFRYSSL